MSNIFADSLGRGEFRAKSQIGDSEIVMGIFDYENDYRFHVRDKEHTVLCHLGKAQARKLMDALRETLGTKEPPHPKTLDEIVLLINKMGQPTKAAAVAYIAAAFGYRIKSL